MIKKTVDTSSGRDVMLCSFKNGVDENSGKDYRSLLAEFDENFVVQELIVQSQELSKIYSSSINTFRVMTYIANNTVYHCPIALRVGRGGADRDNLHYGGIVVGIDNDGTIKPEAFSEYDERFEQHPDTGIVFNSCRISCLGQIKEATKKMHEALPWLGIILWDVTLDIENVPTIVEMNTIGQSAWFPQLANGESLFRENTAYMLEKISKRKKR